MVMEMERGERAGVEVVVGGLSALRTRPCPVWRVEAEKSYTIDFYVAAETAAQAEASADYVVHQEIDDWGMAYDTEVFVSHNPVGDVPQRILDESGGIWVRLGERKGRWVRRMDEVDRVPPLPDPNQMVLPGLLPGLPDPLDPRPRPCRFETIDVRDGVL